MASAPEPWRACPVPYSNPSFSPSRAAARPHAAAPWQWAMALLAGLAQAASLALPGSGAPQNARRLPWLLLAALLLAVALSALLLFGVEA